MNYLAQVDIKNIFDSPIGQSKGLGDIVSLILKGSLTIAGVVVIFFFIMGGMGMMASAGENNPEKAEKSKKMISSAVIGFVIVFVAYWIIRLIEAIIGIPFITEPALQ